MKNLEAHCLIIGSGEQYKELQNLIKKEKLENNISIKEFVPHDEIQRYYKSATVFALAFDPNLEGLPMPVMEAMAVGLPVVIPPPKEGYSEGLEDIAIFSKRDPNSFNKNIKKILDDSNLQKKYSEKSQTKARDFDAIKIEKREAEIYKDLISKQNAKDENFNF